MSLNEPVESAQNHTGKVTVQDLIRVVKGCSDTMSLHGEATPDRASYSDSFCFEFRGTSRAHRTEHSQSIRVPGYVSNGNTSATETYTYEGRQRIKYSDPFRPLKGFWFLGYHQRTLLDILEMLPKDAEVSFHVYLDAGTTENHIRAVVEGNYGTDRGLHSDFLYLDVCYMHRGKRKERRYLIDTHTGLHSYGRFGAR